MKVEVEDVSVVSLPDLRSFNKKNRQEIYNYRLKYLFSPHPVSCLMDGCSWVQPWITRYMCMHLYQSMVGSCWNWPLALASYKANTADLQIQHRISTKSISCMHAYALVVSEAVCSWTRKKLQAGVLESIVILGPEIRSCRIEYNNKIQLNLAFGSLRDRGVDTWLISPLSLSLLRNNWLFVQTHSHCITLMCTR